jgi:hypothetical protein
VALAKSAQHLDIAVLSQATPTIARVESRAHPSDRLEIRSPLSSTIFDSTSPASLVNSDSVGLVRSNGPALFRRGKPQRFMIVAIGMKSCRGANAAKP